MPRPDGWSGPWLQLPRDDDDLVDGASPRDVEARGVLHWAPLGHHGLASRTADLAGWVASARPRLVVVDVSVEVALLVRLAGVPTVVVALPGDRLDRVHRAGYDLAEQLLAPWPVRAHSLSWPAAWMSKVRCVGGISQFDGRPAPGVRRRPGRVLLLWGGGGREVSKRDVDEARRATPGWTWMERSPLHPSPDLWRELHECEVVVTHAGQNAVADVAAARAPAVVVAQQRPFGEQVATAGALRRTGTAVALDEWPSADAWPSLLDRARDAGGSSWGRWTTGRGADDAASGLDALAGDAHARASA